MPRPTAHRALILLLTVVFFSSACASWERTRDEIITPPNQLVHFDYPAALGSGDPELVARMFSLELAQWAAEDAREITARFSRIDRCRCVIYDASAPDDSGGVRTQCVLRVDGLSDGERLTWQQDRIITARPEAGEWKIVRVEADHTLSVPSGTVYLEEAEARGLDAPNRSRGSLDRTGEVRTYLGSAGVAVGDVDGDGADDLLMISGDKLRLFLNRDGQFDDVTSSCGITTPEQGECRCGYFADIDNDGDQDLFVGMLGGENQLFSNDGEGRFRRVPVEQSGLSTPDGQTSATSTGTATWTWSSPTATTST